MSTARSVKKSLGLMGVVVALALSGCGASEVVEEDSASAQGEGTTEYPLTIENCGREITIDKAPQKVVSLDQDSTEILLSLGLEEQIAGTASWTDPILDALAEANEKVPRLSDDAPTYEVLLDADPDFVTASFGRHYNEEGGVVTRDRLAETGIESYLSPTDCEGGTSINGGGTRTQLVTMESLYQEIRDMAAIFDVKDRGEKLISDLQSRTDAALEGVDLQGTTVAFWFADTRTPYFAGEFGAPGMLAEMTGMENVFADSPDDWLATGWETVVEKDPRVIVLGDLQRDRFPGDRLEDKIEFLKSDPLTKTMGAVQNECFIALHGAELNPSIRSVEGLEKIGTWAKESDGCLGAS
ncbi:iron complex transport system substrate-binding protein [Brevibacterium sanguinis]|uniref:Iron complex transport system substrate-binding protein n=2 Tax=Brevibacterium TaxID=1696 RepID=A0A366IJH1_9MICO|nr:MULTISPECIES: ABC transporter substrate-binding protein [Brevibacterium]RBP64258.1 iron complex transport system substrate-binding protein [Brevibacterium sanguinis]RBP71450.1 iron complex transport system substrate-binding protein [Brevibacterium celere]